MNQLNRLLEADTSPWPWLRRHGLYWVVFTLILSLSWIYWMGTFQQALVSLVGGYPLIIPLTYLFLYFVLPTLLRSQYHAFAFRLVVWLIINFALRFVYIYFLSDPLSQTAFSANPLRQLFDTSFMCFNNFVAMAASLKMFRYWYLKEQANQQLARETLSVELKVLRAQVHPHFLFNTLNNIYSLTLRQSESTTAVVQKLSGLLRYMFWECNASQVFLAKEIELIRNYTELEQIRYGNRLNIDLDIQPGLTDKQMAPLLLIPLLENAFKHGVSTQTEQTSIRLMLTVTGNTLFFSLENGRNNETACSPTPHGGLGLANVRKRLALLYPDRHSLTAQAEPTRFRVELTLQLEP